MEIDPNAKDVYVEKNFFSQNIPPGERTAVFNALFFHAKKKWKSSFALMLFLSVGIASLALSENSSASIIGAMIIAPLGQPIVALGGAIALGWKIQSFRMLGIIVVGTISSLAIAYLFGISLPDVTPNQQILIRTLPDLRDLGIAVFAGAAGAYGYYRSEYSTVLTGVAISVALVPPLCVCGLMIEEGYYILAKGSLLLFLTNLIGVIFSSNLVFFLLGLNQKYKRKWFYTGTIVILITGASLLLPLTLNYNNFTESAQFQRSIFEKAVDVLKYSEKTPTIKDISIQGSAAIIAIDPFPQDRPTLKSLTIELERATKLQVFLEKGN